MAKSQIFKTYYNRLAAEGILKSFICGLAIGFTVTFFVALGIWFTNLPVAALVLIPLGSGIAVVAACTAVFYFRLFRPTTEKIAKRIDALGLEERIVTMLELENDNSYIAMRQREDAKQKLNAVSAKSVKYSLSKAPIIVASVTCALAVAMTTVAGLSGSGLIARGMDFVDDVFNDNEPVYCEVYYLVMGVTADGDQVLDEGGLIEGDIEQLILKGKDGVGTEVTAVPEDGWAFAGWILAILDDKGEIVESYQDEEITEPVRTDSGINSDMQIYAVFQENGEGGDGEPGDGDPSDEPQDDDDNKPSGGDQSPPPDGDPDDNTSGGNSPNNDNNNIIDNETYYREVLGEYYDIIMEYITAGEDIPEDLKAIIELYYGIIL